MNLKSKLVGFGAAAVLSLSMAGGAMAQDADIDATADLTPGQCSVSAFSGQGGLAADFGDWKWDGDSYELEVPGSNAVTFQAGVKNHKYNGKCDIGVRSTGLHNGGDTIAPGFINMETNDNTYYNVNLSSTYQTGTFGAGSLNATFTLLDVPDNVDTGLYEGDIEIQVQNGV